MKADGVDTTATENESSPDLKKTLGLFELTATGIGIILGAGIYVIIGKSAGLSGTALWIPFTFGAFAAALTGLSYAELSSMFPKSAASFEYTRHAFGLRAAFVVGWLMLFANIVSAGAVALGFGGYLSSLAGMPIVPIAVLLILICATLLVIGVKEAVWVGVLFTAIEVGGLVIVIAVSARFWGSVNYLETPEGITGLFRATTLLFFAYIGFEQVANLSEEAKNARRNVPLAIIIAVVFTTALYIAVGISSVSVIGWQELAGSAAPLADVVRAATSAEVSNVIGVIALFATANTVLFMMLTSSRLMFGMARANTLPKRAGNVHPKRKTPMVAIVISAAIAIAFAFMRDIQVVAEISNFAVLLAFVVVNAALIRLRRTRPEADRGFRVPGEIRGVPILPILAVGVSLFMLANVGVRALVLGSVIALVGLLVPLVYRNFGVESASGDQERNSANTPDVA